jgi:hypothetical protein
MKNYPKKIILIFCTRNVTYYFTCKSFLQIEPSFEWKKAETACWDIANIRKLFRQSKEEQPARMMLFANCSTYYLFYSPAMMGAAKAAGGFASLQGYSKQGVLRVQGAMCGSVGIYR